jgi:hypothetical protein
MHAPSVDQRSAARFDTAMPVRIDGAHGHTHDISTHGVCFDTHVRQTIGDLINFTLEYTLFGQRHHLLCEGKVVRVEEREEGVRVAARLLAPLFEETAAA